MKIKSFFKDINGAKNVTEKRKNNILNSSETINKIDPINELAKELHPGPIQCKITRIRDVSCDVKEFRFEPVSGSLPPFEAGQYVSIIVNVLGIDTSRPYSIISAPKNALSLNPYFEICVKKCHHGFVSKYLFEDVVVGQSLMCDLPHGHFYIEPLRDTKYILGLAGGSGITPFISMAREIAYGKLDVNLTILYGTKSHEEDILDDELNEIVSKCNKVKLVHVISAENEITRFGDEKGFINKSLIEKYSLDYKPSNGKTTYFICGPQMMYKFVLGQLMNLNVEPKRIRREIFGEINDIREDKEYPLKDPTRFDIKVIRGIDETIISALSIESLAVSLEKNHIGIHTCCRSGECGMCRIKVISGDYFVPNITDNRRRADIRFNYTHACNTYPLSNMTIKIDII
ncbi:MAG: iron-sulfur cluster-binding domain-containing protein [Acholeplasmatales bacterium]|nr:iron-sulfur cluster-binding domain-containing protein [Acholeplasmatales bacterium]